MMFRRNIVISIKLGWKIKVENLERRGEEIISDVKRMAALCQLHMTEPYCNCFHFLAELL